MLQFYIISDNYYYYRLCVQKIVKAESNETTSKEA